MASTSTTIEVLLGGILRFVDPDDWDTILLDLDNGGSAGDKEYWRDDQTIFPLPSPEQNFEEPDIEDGGELISTRMPNREIILVLLVTGSSKANLDEAFRDLYEEINKKDSILEYRPEGSSFSLYYHTYQYMELEQSEYFIHKDRSSTEFFAYNVMITLPCHPFAEADWVELYATKALGSNDSFELRSGDDFNGWVEAGGVTADIANYRFGATGCKLTNSGSSIEDEDFLPVIELHHYNAQVFGYKISGTIDLDFVIDCYDEDKNLLDTLTLFSGVTAVATTWKDLCIDENPVISPSNSTELIRWPEGTAYMKRNISQNDTGVITLDTLLIADSEYVIGHQLEGAFGLNIPPDVVEGDVSSLADIYIEDIYPPAEWGQQVSGVTDNLYGISALDSTHIYAVGASGKILMWNGVTWSTESSGTSNKLTRVNVLDSTHIWAVGADGTILFSNGTTWSAQTYPAFDELLTSYDRSIESWSGDDPLQYTFAAGSSNECDLLEVQKTSYHYSGSYAALTNGAGYVPSHNIIHWHLYNDNYVPINPNRTYRFSLYAALYGYINTGNYLRIRFYTSSYTYISYAYVLSNFTTSMSWVQKAGTLNAASIPSNARYARVGVEQLTDLGASYWAGSIEMWDYLSFKQYTKPELRGVHAITSSNVIAVGEWGHIVKYAGASWTEKTSGVLTDLNDVTAVDATHIWAVGDGGVILFSADGTTWTPQTSGTTEDLYGCYALDSSHVWAVGANGVILFYNGSIWASQTSPVSSKLNEVWAYDSTHAFAVGDGGVLLIFNGTVWLQTGTGTTNNLNGVSGIADDEVWVVGDGGLILFGINATSPMVMTNFILGQKKDYEENFDPVRDAAGATQTLLHTRHNQAYRAMAAGTTEEWLFNIGSHRGRYLLSIGACVSAGAVDQVNLTYQLKTLAGVAITAMTSSDEVDLSDASGYTALQYFREIAMLDERFIPIDIPTFYVSENANPYNMAQSILLTAGALGADFLWVDCISLIPIDRAFVELNTWGYNSLILDSHGGLVLASLDGSLNSAMVFDGSYWSNAPRFYADPLGMNMTVVASYKTGTTTSQDYKLYPRLNMTLKYKPKYFLVKT